MTAFTDLGEGFGLAKKDRPPHGLEKSSQVQKELRMSSEGQDCPAQQTLAFHAAKGSNRPYFGPLSIPPSVILDSLASSSGSHF